MCDFCLRQQNLSTYAENCSIGYTEHFFYAEGLCCVAREALMSVVLTFVLVLCHEITQLTKENLLYYSSAIMNK